MIKPLVKKDLYSNFISPHFYISSIILYLSTTFNFFILNRFFVEGIGTSSLNSFFTFIPYIFSFIIPILVLQFSNKELENSFYQNSFQIITSKLLSTTIILILMNVPLIAVPVTVSFFGQVDAGLEIVAFIGILLYGILAISLCLFINELVSSKPAFVATSIVSLIVIDSIHVLSLYIKTNRFFSEVFRFLSFTWHFNSFSKGIIDSRHICFFIFSSFVFLLLAYFINESKKGKSFFCRQNRKYSILFILIFIFAFIDSSKFYVRFDFSKDKQFSLNTYTKQNLKSVTEPLTITYYRSKELYNRYSEVHDIFDYLKILTQENKNILLVVKDADKEQNQDILKKLNVASQQIQIVENNKTEYIKVYSAIVIEYLGKQKVLPLVLSTNSLEFELNLRLDALIHNKNRNVYLLCGNEYEINDYSYLQSILEASDITPYVLTKESLDFLIEQIELDSPLIIFGTNRLTQDQSAAIENFILKGGKVFVATSKYSAAINGDWSITKNVDDNFVPILEHWGLHFEDKLVNDLANARISFMSANKDSQNSEYEYINYPQWISVLPQKNAQFGLSMFWASPIQLSNQIEPIFTSSDYAWTVKEYDSKIVQETNSYFLTNPFTVSQNYIADSLFTKEKSILAANIKGPVTGLYNFKSIENPRVLVLSDQYFAMNLLLELSSGGASDFRNLDFILSSIFKLLDEDELLKMQNAGYKNISLYKITDLEKFNKAKIISLEIDFIVIPLLYLILALIVYILRKKQNEKYR